MPIDHIEKGTQEGTGREIYKIRGVASTNKKDLDGHTLQPTGFDSSYLLENGHFNYNHQAKGSPAAHIGEPTLAELRYDDAGNPQYWVEGFLYGDHPLAQECAEHMNRLKKNKSKRKMKFSIEGKPIELNPDDKNDVTRTLITGIALTTTPKNSDTWAELVKSIVGGQLQADEPAEPAGPAHLATRIYETLPDATPQQVRRIGQLATHLATPTTTTTPMAKTTAPTLDEALDKAFGILGIEKGTVTPPPADDDDDDDDDEDDDDDSLEKAQEHAAGLLKTGAKGSTILKSLAAAGFDEDTAADGYALAKGMVQETPENEQESLQKSIADTEQTLADLKKKAGTPPAAPARRAAPAPAAIPGLTELQKGLDEKFGSVGRVMGEILTQFEQLRHSTSANDERYGRIEGVIQEMAGQSPGPKTLLTKSFAGREFAQVNLAGQGQPTGLTKSISGDRLELIELMDRNVDYNNLDNPQSQRWNEATLAFESSGHLDKGIQAELEKAGGFTIVG